MAALETLFLGDVPKGLWRTFHEGRPLSASLTSSPHLAHWTRSRKLGASAQAPEAEDGLLRGQALRLRAERLEVIESLGAGALERAAGRVSESDFILLLADADGLVVRSDGGGRFQQEAKRTRLIEGASWSEAHRGTNAIGTAALMARPTVVLGHAHYASDYHQLACYAAPVLDVQGRVVAVLDATSVLGNASRRVAATVSAAAQVLSELLRLEAYANAGSTVLGALLRTLDRSAEPALIIEAPGHVTRVNDAARALGIRGHRVDHALGLRWSELLQEALEPTPHGYTIELAQGASRRAFRLYAEPMLGPIPGQSGQPLGVLVQLEPVPERVVVAGGSSRRAFDTIFSEDSALRESIEWALVAARSELPVMLLGETGVGKELFAKAIHEASERAGGPLVSVNCGAIAPSLLESELFGYAPSAFTGADRGGRHGLFHAADGGTLFLDEVAEMPLAMQVALLRVLETGSYRPVGASKSESCDVRVVCATCRDLEASMEEGSFRQDLYYRLKGAAVRIPPLRERSDRLALARQLLNELAQRMGWAPSPTFSPAAEACLVRHHWPGNVRELLSTLEVALVKVYAAGAREIDVSHLPPEYAISAGKLLPAKGALKRAEAKALKRALDNCRGNVSAAARELGIARSTLYRLARRMGISLGSASD